MKWRSSNQTLVWGVGIPGSNLPPNAHTTHAGYMDEEVERTLVADMQLVPSKCSMLMVARGGRGSPGKLLGFVE